MKTWFWIIVWNRRVRNEYCELTGGKRYISISKEWNTPNDLGPWIQEDPASSKSKRSTLSSMRFDEQLRNCILQLKYEKKEMHFQAPLY